MIIHYFGRNFTDLNDVTSKFILIAFILSSYCQNN